MSDISTNSCMYPIEYVNLFEAFNLFHCLNKRKENLNAHD